MTNNILKEIIDNHKSKSNKELANILLTLEGDFNNIKNTILELTDLMKELEITYETIFSELQTRLKFKNES